LTEAPEGPIRNTVGGLISQRQFRGDARVKDDKDISDADIIAYNLILSNALSSNKILAKIAAEVPVKRDKDSVQVGNATYETSHHVPVLIYPKPLNQTRYIVVNGSFTFRGYDYLNNARQVPKRLDFAVVNVDVAVSSRAPAGLVTAGFITEDWELPAVR
jgi:hypothetical protein